MLNSDSKETLMNLLILDLKKYIGSHSFKNSIIENTRGRIDLNKILKLLNTQIQIEYFESLDELYFLNKAFYSFSKDKSIDPNKFFTDVEILELENSPMLEEDEDKNSNFIIIENVYPGVDDRTWKCTKIHFKQIVDEVFKGKVSYDWRIQRESKKIRTKDKIVERIWTKEENVREIVNAIKERKQESDELVWNVLDNGLAKEPFYDEQNHRLIIELNEDTLVQLVDGWHRTKAAMNVLSEDPDFEYYYELKITYYSIERTLECVRQKGKATPLTIERVKTLDTSDEYSITKRINSHGSVSNNLLYDKIGVTSDLKVGKLMIETTLAETIQKYFDLEKNNIRQQQKISEFLVDFYNTFISCFKEYFDDKNTQYVMTNSNILCALIPIASDIYNSKQNKWYDLFELFIEGYEWNNLESYKNLNISRGKRKELEKTIYNDYVNFKNKVGE